ncbi:ABC transporter substrate-binding protein [Vibrio aquaticus]|uniref:ABC transporter substrate-binding protein n=1 Tax=Vibrio aquaticus TaxID=2496559 RepID=A0A3S0P8S5_9VIBR|nr:ABC transporter substrate-binding protein [Vibrio aquaticus]RTZ17872.1 ABC transporter substrate-binding protein [Vibrio aquaticus]
MFERAGVGFVINHSPEARAMKSARRVENVCSFPVARSQLVEANFNWVGPIAISQYALYQKQPNQPQLLSLQDASPLKIVAYEGYRIAKQLKEQGFNIVMTEEIDDGLQMLRRDGIDLWLSDTRTAQALSEDLGITVANQPFIFLTDIKYLACNKEIPPSKIAKLQQQINSMIKAGELVLIPRDN